MAPPRTRLATLGHPTIDYGEPSPLEDTSDDATDQVMTRVDCTGTTEVFDSAEMTGVVEGAKPT